LQKELDMQLACIGCSFKTASLDFRESVFRLLSKAEQLGTNRIFCCVESTSIVTCNRVELFLVSHNIRKTIELVTKYLNVNSLEPGNRLYFFQGSDAVKHLLRVSCGLDSAALFEEQVRYQLFRSNIKERLRGNSKAVLSSLFDFCFSTSEKLRKKHGISAGVSIGVAALEIIERIGLHPKKTLLIGSGKTISLLLNKLDKKRTYIYTRRKDLPENLKSIKKVSREELRDLAKDADLIISATVSEDHILRKEDLRGVKKIVLDLGFPRNIDPEASELDNVNFYDIDKIAHSISGKRSYSHNLEQSIEEEALSFYGYINVTKLQRVLPAIYEWAESIRKNELNHAIKELSNTTNREIIMEAMSKSIVSKILYPVQLFARRNGNSNLLREVFQDVFRDKED
jgi:glutamyl-tRNA reductase